MIAITAPRTDAEYGQVELLTNLEDGCAYIRVKGGYYALDVEGVQSAVGKIVDKDTQRRMGLALLALSGFKLEVGQ